MLYPAPPLLRLLTHPINEGHRIFEVFLLTRLNRRKKKTKINLGFRWFCCSWACDSWSAVTFISVPFLSGFPHVFLSTFRFRLASSAPSVRHGSPPPWDTDNEGCFWMGGGDARQLLKEWGDGGKQRGVFEMTDYNTTRTRSGTKWTARPFTLPVPRSHCARLMTTERSCLINMYSLLLLENCCTVFLFFFSSLSPRQELFLPLCDRLANLWKPSRTEIHGFTGITSCLRHRGFS